MNKIWIVENEWSYDGCADDVSNIYEHDVEAVFESEDKAIHYILGELEKKLRIKRGEIIEDECKQLWPEDYCDGLTFTELPDEGIIKRDKKFIFNREYGEEYGYFYYDIMVQ